VEEKFKYATFAPEVIEDFRKILEEIGEHPIIIRSSSSWKTTSAWPFSGKYLSVFLTNQGDLEDPPEPFHPRTGNGSSPAPSGPTPSSTAWTMAPGF